MTDPAVRTITMTDPAVRTTVMTADHAADVLRIYAAGMATGVATFEHTPPAWASFDADHLPDHRFVAVDGDGAVLGWAAVSPVSGRCVYAGVVELSVYVDPAAHGRGVGRTLVERVMTSAREVGIWTVQSSVFPQNTASLALHAATGFRVVGTRERFGKMSYGPWADQWLDVLLLERRL